MVEAEGRYLILMGRQELSWPCAGTPRGDSELMSDSFDNRVRAIRTRKEVLRAVTEDRPLLRDWRNSI